MAGGGGGAWASPSRLAPWALGWVGRSSSRATPRARLGRVQGSAWGRGRGSGRATRGLHATHGPARGTPARRGPAAPTPACRHPPAAPGAAGRRRRRRHWRGRAGTRPPARPPATHLGLSRPSASASARPGALAPHPRGPALLPALRPARAGSGRCGCPPVQSGGEGSKAAGRARPLSAPAPTQWSWRGAEGPDSGPRGADTGWKGKGG